MPGASGQQLIYRQPIYLSSQFRVNTGDNPTDSNYNLAPVRLRRVYLSDITFPSSFVNITISGNPRIGICVGGQYGSATITDGSYTPTQLAALLKTALDGVLTGLGVTDAFIVTYSSSTNKYTFSTINTDWTLLWLSSTDPNHYTTLDPSLIGFSGIIDLVASQITDVCGHTTYNVTSTAAVATSTITNIMLDLSSSAHVTSTIRHPNNQTNLTGNWIIHASTSVGHNTIRKTFDDPILIIDYGSPTRISNFRVTLRNPDNNAIINSSSSDNIILTLIGETDSI